MLISSGGIVRETVLQTIKINVRGHDLELCLEPGCEPSSAKNDVSKVQVAVHKSLLQKAVRRMNLNEGLRACEWLWENSQTDLFRRLPIISVEDGYYIPSDNYMWMWMMLINSKGYTIRSNDLKTRLMKSVESLILHPCYSRKYETVPGGPSTDMTEMILPLKIRASYGGMVGDMMMLEKFIEEYNPNEKFRGISHVTPSTGSLFEACDFHVFPWLVKDNEMKGAFWKYRSGINLRDRGSIQTPPPRLKKALEEYDTRCINLYNQYL